MLLGLVFLAALGVRVANWWGQWQNNPLAATPVMDEAMHHEWALRIVSGTGLGEIPYFRAPLYYYLLAGLYAVFGPQIALARLLGGVLGAVTCYLIARLGVKLAGFPAGLLAGALAAFYWPLIYFDNHLLTVGVELFLNVLLLLVLMRAAERGTGVLFLGAGVVWGLAAAARPTILTFAPGLLLWLWWMARRSAPRWRFLPAAGLLLGGAALAILPVTIRNRVVGGEWVLIATNGGINFYIGNNPRADGIAAVVPDTRPGWEEGYEDTHRIPEAELGRRLSEKEVSDYWFRKGRDWMRDEPGAWLRLTVHKLRLFWSPVEIGNNLPVNYFARLSGISAVYWIGFPLVACLGMAGLLVLRRGEWGAWSLPLLYFLFSMGTVVLFFCPARYRLPAVPVLILLTAAGLVRLPAIIRERKVAVLIPSAAAAVLTAVFLWSNPPPREAFARTCEGQAHGQLAQHYRNLARAEPTYYEDALLHLRKAVALRPDDWTLHIALGACLMETKRVAEAGPVLARAVALNPRDPDTHLAYGGYLQVVGRMPEAVDEFRRLVELDPQNADAHFRLGCMLKRVGRAGEAEEHLRTAAQYYETALSQMQKSLLRPEEATLCLSLGACLMEMNRVAEAGPPLARAVELNPRDREGRLYYGCQLQGVGRLNEAADQFRALLGLNPQHAEAHYRLGYTLSRLGRTAEADPHLRRAADLRPDLFPYRGSAP